MKRMAAPVRARPRQKRRIPVSAVASATTIMTGASRSSGGPVSINRSATVAASVAVTAAVAPSGPAIAKGIELRAATNAALMAVVIKVAANAVGEPRIKRRGEDEGGKGEAVSDRDDAGGEASKEVCRLSPEVGNQASLVPGDTVDGHPPNPRKPQ